MGLSPLNVTTNVTITILDQNDNSPVIQNITVFNGNLTISTDNMSVIVIPEDQPTFERVSHCLLYNQLLTVNYINCQ